MEIRQGHYYTKHEVIVKAYAASHQIFLPMNAVITNLPCRTHRALYFSRPKREILIIRRINMPALGFGIKLNMMTLPTSWLLRDSTFKTAPVRTFSTAQKAGSQSPLSSQSMFANETHVLCVIVHAHCMVPMYEAWLGTPGTQSDL